MTGRKKGKSVLFYLLTVLPNGGYAGYDVTIIPRCT
jgi:hypothetical protein